MITATNTLEHIDILLVDDDASIIELLVDLFSDYQNLDLKAYTDSEKAIESIQSNSYDIIITDLKMPKYTGMDILRITRQVNPGALVVLVTGFGSLETTLEAVRLGAYDYLTKPFQIPEFEMKLNSAMRHVQLLRNIDLLKSELEEKEKINSDLHQEISSLQERIKKLEYQKSQESRVLGIGRMQDVSSPSDYKVSTNPYDTGVQRTREQLRRELKKIDDLKNQGVLNEEEHENSKKRILKAYYS